MAFLSYNPDLRTIKSSRNDSAKWINRPTVAVSLKWNDNPNHAKWLIDHGFSLEYTPDPNHFELLPDLLWPFLKNGVQIRHHGLFPGYDIGAQDDEKAKSAMAVHMTAIDSISNLGEPHITFHLALNIGIQFDPDKAVTNLTRLVEYGKFKKTNVNIENLKNGIASQPEMILEWAEKSGAGITLDIGHALSSEIVKSGQFSLNQMIDMFEGRLTEVHLYEKETDRHHPPRNMSVLGPVLDRLLQTDCRWWTIELTEKSEILNTNHLLQDYLMISIDYSIP